MVTCELSRVCCWLRRRQQQISTCRPQEEEKAYQEPKTALGAFRKRSMRVAEEVDHLREEGGNIKVDVNCSYYIHSKLYRHVPAWSHPSPSPPTGRWEVCYPL